MTMISLKMVKFKTNIQILKFLYMYSDKATKTGRNLEILFDFTYQVCP